MYATEFFIYMYIEQVLFYGKIYTIRTCSRTNRSQRAVYKKTQHTKNFGRASKSSCILHAMTFAKVFGDSMTIIVTLSSNTPFSKLPTPKHIHSKKVKKIFWLLACGSKFDESNFFKDYILKNIRKFVLSSFMVLLSYKVLGQTNTSKA